MDEGLRHNPPVVHWCAERDEYLNIPVNDDGSGHRLGGCPYCGVMLWEFGPGVHQGRKGGEVMDNGRAEK